jgi:hypothetical protein
VRSVFVLHFLASVVFNHTPLSRIFFTFLIVEKYLANFYFKFEKGETFPLPLSSGSYVHVSAFER